MNNVITKEFAKTILPERNENSHKGTFGSILNIAGSVNYRGAAFLSTISALKTGAGYIALASIDEVINSVSKLCPEAVFVPLKSKYGTIAKNEFKIIEKLLPKYKVLCLGCGISSLNQNQKEIQGFIKNLIKNITNIKIPVIIDADGLNIISELGITNLPEKSILTPHPNELSRLIDVKAEIINQNREEYAVLTAKKYNSIVVLKGHETVITDGTGVFINKTGNSALAKAGSGDVLAGIISGLCAQGVIPIEASLLGVYIHGIAGEIASKELSLYGVNASDLISYIPNAIKTLSD